MAGTSASLSLVSLGFSAGSLGMFLIVEQSGTREAAVSRGAWWGTGREEELLCPILAGGSAALGAPGVRGPGACL